MPAPLFQNINIPFGIQAMVNHYIDTNAPTVIQYLDLHFHNDMVNFFNTWVINYLDELRGQGWWIINQTGVDVGIDVERVTQREIDPYVVIDAESVTVKEEEVTI